MTWSWTFPEPYHVAFSKINSYVYIKSELNRK